KGIWDIFLLPEELAAVKKVFADLHHNLLPNSYKNYWITRNGNRRYISWSNTVLVDDNRQVEHIIGTGLDITEQYAMEQALIKSEHSYRILASNIPAAVYRSTLIDNKFQTEFFNDMMQTMTGYAASEMPSDEACSFGKFILDQDLEKVRKQIRQAVDNKSTFEIEYRIRHKNGDIKFFRDRGRPVYDEDGNITHIDGTIIDDTERILVNNALKESENKFRALTEKSMVGVYLIQDGRFRYVNPHFSAIFCFFYDKLLDMNAMHFVAREDRCGLVKTIRSQIGNRSSFHTTFHCFTREGKRIDVETYGNRTVFRGMPAIIGTLMDITKRKIIEQALQEQMLRYEQILQTSMDGFLLINASGKILDVNPAYCQMLGYNSKDILDLNIMDIDIQMTPQNFYKKMKQLAQKGLASYETQNRRKDGSIIDVEISISVMNSNGGWIAAIFVRDITQRKQQESSEKQSLLDLAHASRLSTMGEMATEFAHELNQPLSAISTYSNVALKLLNAGIIDQDLTEALQGIYGQANRAGEIIRSLRDFIGKRESAVAITDINELIRLVIRLVKSETTMNQILINLELSEQLPEIVTEKILIEQVLLNITRNAIEALSEITAERQLHIRSFMNSQNMIEIKITDNGPGLPYEEPDQVFDAFYSTKDHGMGMGLAISRSIIESHGGKLWARNNPDRGACFSFTLPVMIEE
ncbi:MAG: PAS domain S-box protein, partial [Gammaproteobacteria bacterium]